MNKYFSHVNFLSLSLSCRFAPCLCFFLYSSFFLLLALSHMIFHPPFLCSPISVILLQYIQFLFKATGYDHHLSFTPLSPPFPLPLPSFHHLISSFSIISLPLPHFFPLACPFLVVSEDSSASLHRSLVPRPWLKINADLQSQSSLFA